MTNPTVLVSGASRGLGAATARMVAELGANVALMARSEDDLAAVARDVEAEGSQALAITGDVSRPDDCRRVVEETVEHFGRLDALVNNAGVLGPVAPFAEWDPEGWRQNLAVNVLGVVWLTQAALPHLRQRSGRVMNVSSGAAAHVVSGWAAYCASKAALNHLTRALAEEEPEVTALAFRPGVVDTAMQRQIRQEGDEGMPDEVHARFIRYHEAGELLPPEVPGCALAVLALHAPPDWSGQFLPWDAEEVQALVRRYGCASSA